MIGSPRAATSGKYDGDGRWMLWGSGSGTSLASGGRSASGTSRPRSSSVYFWCQKSSRACTSGITAKLYSGGGDGIDHSSVRPSQGSDDAGASLALTMTL